MDLYALVELEAGRAVSGLTEANVGLTRCGLRIVYTTNPIGALNSKLHCAVRARGHFPNDEAVTPGGNSCPNNRGRGGPPDGH